MFKMGLHDPFGYLKHKLWPKEGPIDSRPLKVGNRPYLFACRWRVRYCWENFDEGYNFALDLTLIKGLKKIMGLQSRKNPNFENFGTPNLGVLRQNDIWV